MSEFYNGMAEIFELDPTSITPEFELHSTEVAWDSLAVVSTIALVDDCFGLMLEGKALSACEKISDIENLIETAKKR